MCGTRSPRRRTARWSYEDRRRRPLDPRGGAPRRRLARGLIPLDSVLLQASLYSVNV
jgi:hypothetical protein